MRSKEKPARSILPILVLAAAAVCVFLLLFVEPIRDALLDPIARALHDMRTSLRALPQTFQWGCAILLGVVLLATSWKRTPTKPRPRWTRREPAVVKPHNRNAIESLARSLARSERRHVSRVRVIREVSILAVRLIAQREGCSLEQARKLLNSGEWTQDPLVRKFFASHRDRGNHRKESFSHTVSHTLEYLERYYQEV